MKKTIRFNVLFSYANYQELHEPSSDENYGVEKDGYFFFPIQIFSFCGQCCNVLEIPLKPV